MKKKNRVIGIEGLVGAGKTALCKQLLNFLPGSILLSGGDIYRAVVFGIQQSGMQLEQMQEKLLKVDMRTILEKLQLEIKIENRQSIIYLRGKKIEEKDLQSLDSSLAVSTVSKIADNSRLYEFGKQVINQFKKQYTVILSSRDIVRMYPEVDYHFFITASLQERLRRKMIQYGKNASENEVRQMIEKRDELQKQAGYYDITQKTIIIDVTNCKTPKESAQQVFKYIQ